MIVKNESVQLEKVGEGVHRKILASNGGLMTVEVIFNKGAIGAVHTHPHEQVCYVLAGSFEFDLNGKKEVITQGDTYYVEPNIPHGVVALEDGILLDVFTPQREDFLKK